MYAPARLPAATTDVSRGDHAHEGWKHEDAVLELGGELDMAGAAALKARIVKVWADGAGRISLDLQGVTFMDSAALRAIISAAEICQRHGCSVTLVSSSPAVERLLAHRWPASASPAQGLMR